MRCKGPMLLGHAPVPTLKRDPHLSWGTIQPKIDVDQKNIVCTMKDGPLRVKEIEEVSRWKLFAREATVVIVAQFRATADTILHDVPRSNACKPGSVSGGLASST
jgi:hypothetical protein